MSLFDNTPSTDSGEAPPVRKRGVAISILPFTTVILLIVAAYVGWTMWSRYESNKEAERSAKEKAETAERQREAEITHHGELMFTTFFAEKGHLRRGEATTLCYGVDNATALRLDPAPAGEQIKPTARHCIDIAPKKTTTYTLTATGDNGQTKTSSLTVEVR